MAKTAKWLLTVARTLGLSSQVLAVFDQDELNQSLRTAGKRADLTVTVTPVRTSQQRRSH
jgi:hypothetical protein